MSDVALVSWKVGTGRLDVGVFSFCLFKEAQHPQYVLERTFQQEFEDAEHMLRSIDSMHGFGQTQEIVVSVTTPCKHISHTTCLGPAASSLKFRQLTSFEVFCRVTAFDTNKRRRPQHGVLGVRCCPVFWSTSPGSHRSGRLVQLEHSSLSKGLADCSVGPGSPPRKVCQADSPLQGQCHVFWRPEAP